MYGTTIGCKAQTTTMEPGERRLSGWQGSFTKEAGHIVISWAMRNEAHLKTWLGGPGLEPGEGVHIHVEEFLDVIDGKSIGAAFAVVLVSRLSERMIRSNICITGELNLRGYIIDVDGIPEKLEAASRAGFSKVLIPQANMEQWHTVKPGLNSQLRQYGEAAIHPVSHILEALEIMLEGK